MWWIVRVYVSVCVCVFVCAFALLLIDVAASHQSRGHACRAAMSPVDAVAGLLRQVYAGYCDVIGHVMWCVVVR